VKRFKPTLIRRLANPLVERLIRAGAVPRSVQLLTTRGRRSGRLYTHPVMLVMRGERSWLVAPYGKVGWVYNARTAGRVTLTRGGRSREVTVREVESAEAAPVLKAYLLQGPVVFPYFEVRPWAPLAAFEDEAAHHPVFELGTAD